MKKFKIYQLPVENNAKFMGLEFVTEHNIMPKLEDYNLVYEGEVEDDADLDDIYRMLNVARPKDYKGHSLSVSDVVEIGGCYFYCDSYGWEEVYKTSEPTSEKHEITIPTEAVEDFQKMMKKAAKNINGLTWNIGEGYRKIYRHNIDGYLEKWWHNVTDVTFEIPTVNDWRLLATVIEGELFVTNPRNELHLKNGHGADYRICDVCKHRQFKKSFIVKNEKTGEELQVGSECAKKFNIGLVNAIYNLTNELYASYCLFGGEDDGEPAIWHSHYKDPHAVRSVETSVIVQAAKKYYDDHNGVWIKGYYTGEGWYREYIPSESAAAIKADLDKYTADSNNEYYRELTAWIKENLKADMYNEFEQSMMRVGTDFYMSAGDVAAVFFAIKRYEQYKREQAAKEGGIYLPKKGDYVHIIGTIVNKTECSGCFGDYTEYEIYNTLDGNTYKRSGAVNVDADGKVNCYAFIKGFWGGSCNLDRTTKHAKKGVAVANVF